MSDRLKKILLIVGFAAVVGLIAFAIYFVFFRPSGGVVVAPPTVEPGGNTQPGGGLPTTPGGTPTTTPTTPGEEPAAPVAEGGSTETDRLTSSAVLSPTLSTDGTSMSYYDPADGRFYTIGPDGDVVRLSDRQFPNAETIVWDDSAGAVVIEFPDGANVIFDFNTEAQTTLPDHWEDFGFSPSGEEVIAKSIGNDETARALVITSKDASNTEIIAALGDNADLVEVNWSPNEAVVAFSDTGAGATSGGLSRKMIYPIGQNDENFKGLVVEGLNFHSLWSPDGKQILYDVAGPTSNYRPLLWVVDGTPATMGDNRRSLGLNTWVEKCTFADATIVYCAVPVTMADNTGLQPAINTANDSIYRVDLSSGRVRLVGFPEIPTRMLNLSVSEDGRYLYFTDSSGRLQLMRLQ